MLFHTFLVGVSLCLSLSFSLFYSPPSEAGDLSITDYTLVSKKRVSRTDYEYTYTAEVTNTGDAYGGVTASVVSSSPNTTIVDDSISFGDVPANSSLDSSDNFIIRQNRRYAFDPEFLTWDINGIPGGDVLPPDPGEEGKRTILGVDSDNDGVRDDVQIAIANKYPSVTNNNKALTQFAKAIQDRFAGYVNNDLQGMNDALADIEAAINCIVVTSDSPFEDIIYIELLMKNTDERGISYIESSAAASGQSFGGISDLSELEDSCQR